MGLLKIIRNVRNNYEKDGLISWIICLCAFITMAIIEGIDSSFGESLGLIMKDFNSTESNVAWIGSVHSSSNFFFASLSSLLANQYGFGTVIVVGILISSTFFAICTTAYSVSELIIYYGFLSGMGTGLIWTPSAIICSFHFVKRRSLATGIAICGGGVGSILLPLGANIINRSYGLQGYFVFCALMCPFCGLLAFLVVLFPEKYDEELQPLNNNIKITGRNKTNKGTRVERISGKFVEKLAYILAFKELQDIRLLLFCAASVMFFLGRYIPLVFLPDFMEKEQRISHFQSGCIISFYGVSSMLGRLIGGLYISYTGNSAIVSLASSLLFMGVSCIAIALSSFYWHFVISMVIYGMSLGMFIVFRTIALVDMFGTDSLANSYGIVMLCGGASTLVGTPMVGCLKVYLGTYYHAFLVTASIFIGSGVLQMVLVLENKKNKYNTNYDMIGVK